MSLHKHVAGAFAKSTRKIALHSVQKLNQPQSLLIIPDGNARWAKANNKQTVEGHMSGSHALGTLLEQFLHLDTKVVGVWGFSEDNWKRPKGEIDGIFHVIHDAVITNLPKFHKNKVKFLVLGKRDQMKKEFPYVVKAIEKAERETARYTKKCLALFLDYGERYQLEEFAKARAKNHKGTTYELLVKINRGLPLFEMVVRTSGEQRLSGFGPLASLAEFVVINKNLPEVGYRDIVGALREFSSRKRRFGGRPDTKQLNSSSVFSLATTS